MGFALKILSIACILISILCYYLISKDVELIDYCKQNTNILKFNEDLCTDILNGDISVNKTYFQVFINLFSPKSIFWGKFNNVSVVLKTVVSADHVKKMESDFLRIFSNVPNESNDLLFAQLQVQSLINIPLGTSQLPKLRLCPFNSNVDRFINKIPGSSNYGVNDYVQLWTTIYSNPEPLILKMLDPKVWPVPEYFGSCGQLIVVEDCGLTLTNYHDSDWNLRANLTHQLLENALRFTFEDPDFAFYLTDVSPDNIAVTQEGFVKYIDLEHIILVERNSEGSS